MLISTFYNMGGAFQTHSGTGIISAGAFKNKTKLKKTDPLLTPRSTNSFKSSIGLLGQSFLADLRVVKTSYQSNIIQFQKNLPNYLNHVRNVFNSIATELLKLENCDEFLLILGREFLEFSKKTIDLLNLESRSINSELYYLYNQPNVTKSLFNERSKSLLAAVTLHTLTLTRSERLSVGFDMVSKERMQILNIVNKSVHRTDSLLDILASRDAEYIPLHEDTLESMSFLIDKLGDGILNLGRFFNKKTQVAICKHLIQSKNRDEFFKANVQLYHEKIINLFGTNAYKESIAKAVDIIITERFDNVGMQKVKQMLANPNFLLLTLDNSKAMESLARKIANAAKNEEAVRLCFRSIVIGVTPKEQQRRVLSNIITMLRRKFTKMNQLVIFSHELKQIQTQASRSRTMKFKDCNTITACTEMRVILQYLLVKEGEKLWQEELTFWKGTVIVVRPEDREKYVKNQVLRKEWVKNHNLDTTKTGTDKKCFEDLVDYWIGKRYFQRTQKRDEEFEAIYTNCKTSDDSFNTLLNKLKRNEFKNRQYLEEEIKNLTQSIKEHQKEAEITVRSYELEKSKKQGKILKSFEAELNHFGFILMSLELLEKTISRTMVPDVSQSPIIQGKFNNCIEDLKAFIILPKGSIFAVQQLVESKKIAFKNKRRSASVRKTLDLFQDAGTILNKWQDFFFHEKSGLLLELSLQEFNSRKILMLKSTMQNNGILDRINSDIQSFKTKRIAASKPTPSRKVLNCLLAIQQRLLFIHNQLQTAKEIVFLTEVGVPNKQQKLQIAERNLSDIQNKEHILTRNNANAMLCNSAVGAFTEKMSYRNSIIGALDDCNLPELVESSRRLKKTAPKYNMLDVIFDKLIVATSGKPKHPLLRYFDPNKRQILNADTKSHPFNSLQLLNPHKHTFKKLLLDPQRFFSHLEKLGIIDRNGNMISKDYIPGHPGYNFLVSLGILSPPCLYLNKFIIEFAQNPEYSDFSVLDIEARLSRLFSQVASFRPLPPQLIVLSLEDLKTGIERALPQDRSMINPLNRVFLEKIGITFTNVTGEIQFEGGNLKTWYNSHFKKILSPNQFNKALLARTTSDKSIQNLESGIKAKLKLQLSQKQFSEVEDEVIGLVELIFKRTGRAETAKGEYTHNRVQAQIATVKTFRRKSLKLVDVWKKGVFSKDINSPQKIQDIADILADIHTLIELNKDFTFYLPFIWDLSVAVSKGKIKISPSNEENFRRIGISLQRIKILLAQKLKSAQTNAKLGEKELQKQQKQRELLTNSKLSVSVEYNHLRPIRVKLNKNIPLINAQFGLKDKEALKMPKDLNSEEQKQEFNRKIEKLQQKVGRKKIKTVQRNLQMFAEAMPAFFNADFEVKREILLFQTQKEVVPKYTQVGMKQVESKKKIKREELNQSLDANCKMALILEDCHERVKKLELSKLSSTMQSQSQNFQGSIVKRVRDLKKNSMKFQPSYLNEQMTKLFGKQSLRTVLVVKKEIMIWFKENVCGEIDTENKHYKLLFSKARIEAFVRVKTEDEFEKQLSEFAGEVFFFFPFNWASKSKAEELLLTRLKPKFFHRKEKTKQISGGRRISDNLAVYLDKQRETLAQGLKDINNVFTSFHTTETEFIKKDLQSLTLEWIAAHQAYLDNLNQILKQNLAPDVRKRIIAANREFQVKIRRQFAAQNYADNLGIRTRLIIYQQSLGFSPANQQLDKVILDVEKFIFIRDKLSVSHQNDSVRIGLDQRKNVELLELQKTIFADINNLFLTLARIKASFRIPQDDLYKTLYNSFLQAVQTKLGQVFLRKIYLNAANPTTKEVNMMSENVALVASPISGIFANQEWFRRALEYDLFRVKESQLTNLAVRASELNNEFKREMANKGFKMTLEGVNSCLENEKNQIISIETQHAQARKVKFIKFMTALKLAFAEAGFDVSSVDLQGNEVSISTQAILLQDLIKQAQQKIIGLSCYDNKFYKRDEKKEKYKNNILAISEFNKLKGIYKWRNSENFSEDTLEAEFKNGLIALRKGLNEKFMAELTAFNTNTSLEEFERKLECCAKKHIQIGKEIQTILFEKDFCLKSEDYVQADIVMNLIKEASTGIANQDKNLLLRARLNAIILMEINKLEAEIAEMEDSLEKRKLQTRKTEIKRITVPSIGGDQAGLLVSLKGLAKILFEKKQKFYHQDSGTGISDYKNINDFIENERVVTLQTFLRKEWNADTPGQSGLVAAGDKLKVAYFKKAASQLGITKPDRVDVLCETNHGTEAYSGTYIDVKFVGTNKRFHEWKLDVFLPYFCFDKNPEIAIEQLEDILNHLKHLGFHRKNINVPIFARLEQLYARCQIAIAVKNIQAKVNALPDSLEKWQNLAYEVKVLEEKFRGEEFHNEVDLDDEEFEIDTTGNGTANAKLQQLKEFVTQKVMHHSQAITITVTADVASYEGDTTFNKNSLDALKKYLINSKKELDKRLKAKRSLEIMKGELKETLVQERLKLERTLSKVELEVERTIKANIKKALVKFIASIGQNLEIDVVQKRIKDAYELIELLGPLAAYLKDNLKKLEELKQSKVKDFINDQEKEEVIDNVDLKTLSFYSGQQFTALSFEDKKGVIDSLCKFVDDLESYNVKHTARLKYFQILKNVFLPNIYSSKIEGNNKRLGSSGIPAPKNNSDRNNFWKKLQALKENMTELGAIIEYFDEILLADDDDRLKSQGLRKVIRSMKIDVELNLRKYQTIKEKVSAKIIFSYSRVQLHKMIYNCERSLSNPDRLKKPNSWKIFARDYSRIRQAISNYTKLVIGKDVYMRSLNARQAWLSNIQAMKNRLTELEGKMRVLINDQITPELNGGGVGTISNFSLALQPVVDNEEVVAPGFMPIQFQGLRTRFLKVFEIVKQPPSVFQEDALAGEIAGIKDHFIPNLLLFFEFYCGNKNIPLSYWNGFDCKVLKKYISRARQPQKNQLDAFDSLIQIRNLTSDRFSPEYRSKSCDKAKKLLKEAEKRYKRLLVSNLKTELENSIQSLKMQIYLTETRDKKSGSKGKKKTPLKEVISFQSKFDILSEPEEPYGVVLSLDDLKGTKAKKGDVQLALKIESEKRTPKIIYGGTNIQFNGIEINFGAGQGSQVNIIKELFEASSYNFEQTRQIMQILRHYRYQVGILEVNWQGREFEAFILELGKLSLEVRNELFERGIIAINRISARINGWQPEKLQYLPSDVRERLDLANNMTIRAYKPFATVEAHIKTHEGTAPPAIVTDCREILARLRVKESHIWPWDHANMTLITGFVKDMFDFYRTPHAGDSNRGQNIKNYRKMRLKYLALPLPIRIEIVKITKDQSRAWTIAEHLQDKEVELHQLLKKGKGELKRLEPLLTLFSRTKKAEKTISTYLLARLAHADTPEDFEFLEVRREQLYDFFIKCLREPNFYKKINVQWQQDKQDDDNPDFLSFLITCINNNLNLAQSFTALKEIGSEVDLMLTSIKKNSMQETQVGYVNGIINNKLEPELDEGEEEDITNLEKKYIYDFLQKCCNQDFLQRINIDWNRMKTSTQFGNLPLTENILEYLAGKSIQEILLLICVLDFNQSQEKANRALEGINRELLKEQDVLYFDIQRLFPRAMRQKLEIIFSQQGSVTKYLGPNLVQQTVPNPIHKQYRPVVAFLAVDPDKESFNELRNFIDSKRKGNDFVDDWKEDWNGELAGYQKRIAEYFYGLSAEEIEELKQEQDLEGIEV